MQVPVSSHLRLGDTGFNSILLLTEQEAISMPLLAWYESILKPVYKQENSLHKIPL